MIGIQMVRKPKIPLKTWQLSGDDFLQWSAITQNAFTEIAEGDIGFARDDKIGVLGDFLLIGFIRNLRPAEDEGEVGAEASEIRSQAGGLFRVPDVNAQADDFRILSQERFEDVGGALVDVKFEEGGALGEGAEVGMKIAQTEGSVGILGVEGGEEDVGHDKTGAVTGKVR